MINELDGLAKGSREGQYKDPIHAYQVKSCAASAMRYLEEQFELGNKHVRALTGKGTVMDTIMFRSEESSNKVGILSLIIHSFIGNLPYFLLKVGEILKLNIVDE